jgi:hypothetical protein
MALNRRYLWPAAAAIAAAVTCAAAPAASQSPSQTREDGVTVVEGVVSVGIVPPPDVGEGAPYLTPEDLAARLEEAREDQIYARNAARTCRSDVFPTYEYEPDGFALEGLYLTEQEKQAEAWRLGREAHEATERAIEVRQRAASGGAGQDQLEISELRRQQAVNAYLIAEAEAKEARARVADLQSLMNDGTPEDMRRSLVEFWSAGRAVSGGLGVQIPPEFADLELSQITARERVDGEQLALVVTGQIANPRQRAVRVPPISVTALDRNGQALKTVTALPRRGAGRIAGGQAIPFAYELNPMPANSVRAVVTFASERRPAEYLPVSMFCQDRSLPPL